MIALSVCFAVGFLQTVLLSIVLKGALSGDFKKTAIALFSKFLVYGIAFAMLYFLFMDSIFYAGAGFIAGVLISVIIVFVKSKKALAENTEGDVRNEHGRHN